MFAIFADRFAVSVALSFAAGTVTGWFINLCSLSLIRSQARIDTASMGAGASSTLAQDTRPPHARLQATVIALSTGLLFAVYVVAAVQFRCQQIDEVRPEDFWRDARVVYHLVLIALLVAATATDIRDYLIPDQITIPGALIGIAAATISGQLQMVHLWVDWNQEIPGIAGPYIPGWLDQHRHWHGFAWSATGAILGATLAAGVRFASSAILRRESLGLGDVTLMTMIGSYLGWQPVLFVFGIAPLCGMVGLLPLRRLMQGRYLPYGPFLAASTYVVLLGWGGLWKSTRLIFGDAPGLVLLALVAVLAFIFLLVVVRFMGGGLLSKPLPNDEPPVGI